MENTQFSLTPNHCMWVLLFFFFISYLAMDLAEYKGSANEKKAHLCILNILYGAKQFSIVPLIIPNNP